MNKKFITTCLTTNALSIAAAITVDFNNTVTVENVPQCSEGAGNARIEPMNSINPWPGCFVTPKSFEVKVYKILLIPSDSSLAPVVVYTESSPSYVDIASNNFNPLRDFSSLPDGKYSKIEMIVDSRYRISVDERIPNLDGSTSRVISYEQGYNTPSLWTNPSTSNANGLNNIDFSGGGKTDLKYLFPRLSDTDATEATKIEFLQRAFWLESSTVTIETFGGAYGEKAIWTFSNHPTIQKITHFLNLDANGNTLTPNGSYSGKRATVTIDLASDFEYDSTKGVVVNWTWDIQKMFWIAFKSTNQVGYQEKSDINMMTLGPYSFDIKLDIVEKKASGLDELESLSEL
jgi:hypothetical protein